MAPDSPAQSAKDLIGKTIAIDALGSLTQVSTEFWLDKRGVDPQSVKFVEMPFSDMPQALSAHRIDAAFLTEPMQTRSRGMTRILALPDEVMPPVFPTSAWVGTEAWVSADPGRARRFASLMYRTAKWANANRAVTAEILSRFAKMDIDLIHRMPRATYSEQNDSQLLQPLIDVALKYGAIKKPVKIDDLFASTLKGA